MSASAQHLPYEHPLDVLGFVSEQDKLGLSCAIAMLIDTQGGAVRAKGALMAISQNGQSCGYLSGGCIDADIRLQAARALKTAQPRQITYGKGSPFLDISLPCGGRIDILICPEPDLAEIHKTVQSLKARALTAFTLKSADTTYRASAWYTPKLRIRIAGRSADPVALARISASAGIETELWSADTDCLQTALKINTFSTVKLTSPAALPPTGDDAFTAFVLMMHDQDWEPTLLEQALKSPAFYIGAVGSPNTHAKRCEHLLSHGLLKRDVERIKGPIGLVPSMRDLKSKWNLTQQRNPYSSRHKCS